MQRGDRGKRHDKKLSWSFRNKKRISRNERPQHDAANAENVQIQNKKARIVIRNLPFTVTEADIQKHYSPFGEIEELNLLRHPNGKLVGCGFVQFKKIEQASKAIFNTNKKPLLGRIVSSDWAVPKFKFSESVHVGKQGSNVNKDAEEPTENADGASAAGDENESVSKAPTKKQMKKKLKDKKKMKNIEKRARIIVRNLSFNTTEELLRDHFSQYGTVSEVKILSRPDGKRVGCGFVQFNMVQSAAKAIHHANLKPLLDRPIIVDWAIPKYKYADSGKKGEEDKIEEIKEEDDQIKAEETDEKDETLTESVTQTDIETTFDAEGNDAESNDDEKPDPDELNESEDDKDELQASFNDIKEESFENNRPDNRKIVSNDVSEGKTVFLKNVPFSATNDDLRRCMEQYGPIFYALICMDHLTDHSKGTAFVKFQHVEDAEKCLNAGTELRLHDQVLDPHRALNRNEIQDKSERSKNKATDSRNLYLVKEGVILAGSPAAIGVSASDMAMRLQLEQWKSQMLRNLNMFVSRNRLVVHNLPASVDDTKLREIFRNHSGPKAVIREARVMRDLRNIEANGIGKSKEYGFVAFTTHGDALSALRDVNNNPKIFGPNKRPIVAFSIENRVMVNAKNKRIEKSRERNPLWTGNKSKNADDKAVITPGQKGDNSSNRSDRKKRKYPTNRSATYTHQNSDELPAKQARLENGDIMGKSYSGIASQPGETKMRSKFTLKSQAILHHKNRKEESKKMKSNKKEQSKKPEKERAPKQKNRKQRAGKKNQDEANFSKLVNNYKTKLMSEPGVKSKWYEA